ncbi:hypothetical protein [Novosphingobium sp. MMS21-SN21R]|uniref:hypothetical protein n=1 Tax=Novosphingobium sp. MMS21-SN21R TaxID=2969298 RepID=UPI002883B386|nr:hypothetical protein [Novosphingobium sp. MMS21-SN21R]MDT0508335.1 hypothetical protein [Novosphingobium sp. MMS21-SN21R]
MIKVFAAAVIAVAGLPAIASAQSATGTVDVNGSVEGRCLFTVPNETISLGELALGGTDGTAGRLDTAKVDNQSATLSGWCNHAAATMKVEALALVNSAATTSASFTNRVDFTASAAANGATASDTTTDTAVGAEEDVGMFAGDVVVTLASASAGGKLLVAGDYAGQVLVTLAPNF